MVVVLFYNYFLELGLHIMDYLVMTYVDYMEDHNPNGVLDHNINLVVVVVSIWYVDQIKHLNRKRPFDVHDHAFSKILNIFDIIIKEITKLVFSSYMLLLSKLFLLQLI